MSVIFIVWNSSFEISILIIPDIHHNVGLASLGIPSISKCTSRVMWGSKLDLSWCSPQRGSCILGDRNLSCASQELLLWHKKFVVGWMLLQWRNHHKSWRQDFRNNHVEACPTENIHAVLLLWGPFSHVHFSLVATWLRSNGKMLSFLTLSLRSRSPGLFLSSNGAKQTMEPNWTPNF